MATNTNAKADEWNMQTKDLPEFTQPIKVRPTLKFDDWEKVFVYLTGLAMKLDEKVDKYKELATKHATEHYNGQIRYWTNQISTLKWICGLIRQANEK